MPDDRHATLTAKQIRGLVIMAAIFVLLVITFLRTFQGDHWSRPSAAPGQTSAAAPALDPDQQEEVIDMFLGGGGLFTNDPSALHKSVGEPVLLKSGDAALTVTADRIDGGTRPCASGPLVIIDLAVAPQSGTAELSPADFHLMAPDGTAAEPLQNCLTGFAEPATRRTIAFSGVEPDRLVYGSDPLRPVAVWLLT